MKATANRPCNVLLLSSQGSEADRVAAHCDLLFEKVEVFQGEWGDELPEACAWWKGNLIVSYCSRWILPEDLIKKADLALNFHPASPSYRGTGGLNWALYEGADTFGVTCHRMTSAIDAGAILEVRRFPILAMDNAATLHARTHLYLEHMATEILTRISQGDPLPPADEHWSGPVQRRREIDELSSLSLEMSAAEMSRRMRATSFYTLGSFAKRRPSAADRVVRVAARDSLVTRFASKTSTPPCWLSNYKASLPRRRVCAPDRPSLRQLRALSAPR